MKPWEEFIKENQWKSYLKNLVKTNDKALLKAIVCIYDRQTFEEKEAGKSLGKNKIGFNKFDSEEMSDIARKIKAKVKLSENEIIHARITIPKYWKQLMIISKQKQYMQALKEFNEEKSSENKIIYCIENGVSCDYGICDECMKRKENHGEL